MVRIRAFNAVGIYSHDHIIVGCSRLYVRIRKRKPSNEGAVQECGVRSAEHRAAIDIVPGDGRCTSRPGERHGMLRRLDASTREVNR